MVNYLSLPDLSQDLGIYEYEIRTTIPSNDDGYVVGETLTGGTSAKACEVGRVLTNSRYFVHTVTGKQILGETFTGDQNTYTSKLLLSDAIALQNFIERVQDIVERRTKRQILNTGTQNTVKITSKKNKNTYLTPTAMLPIITVDSITYNGQAYTGTEDSDYYVRKDRGIWDFPAGDIGGTQTSTRTGNLELTFTWGNASVTYETVDPAMKHIVSYGVSKIYNRWIAANTAPGMTSISPGQFALTFNFENLFDDDMKEMVNDQTRWLLR